VPPRISLDHIALAVPRLEPALEALKRVFLAEASPPEEVSGEKVRLSFITVGGTRIEVLEGTSPESPVSRFLAGGGKGVHHLSFRLEGLDLAAWCRELVAGGVPVLGGGPRPGAAGQEVIFLHPRATAGVLVEFNQGKAGG